MYESNKGLFTTIRTKYIALRSLILSRKFSSIFNTSHFWLQTVNVMLGAYTIGDVLKHSSNALEDEVLTIGIRLPQNLNLSADSNV